MKISEPKLEDKEPVRHLKASSKLYEINTRVWLRRFDSGDNQAKLDDVPMAYWEGLAQKGINYVWLMGVWKICSSTIEKYCLKEGPVKDSFKTTLRDLQRADIIGSPYAIDRYEVNPLIGNERSILDTRTVLNKLGIKLILDFVPNHFSADSSLIRTDPYVFLQGDFDELSDDSTTFYKPFEDDDRIFAHGRDPFFPAWEDTVQVNYFSPAAREFMMNALMALTRLCDGVRCDMAMLSLNDIFKETWNRIVTKMNDDPPQDEFWTVCIKAVKDAFPDFLFLAEVYWDLEGRLLEMGFDFIYDKKLTDRLYDGSANEIREHLWAADDFQRKSMRFIENHDEQRAVTALGEEKSKAAAVIISTLQGMHFYHDGQFEGRTVKLPVQLGREPLEPVNTNLMQFYKKLLTITSATIFKKGRWLLLEVLPSWDDDPSYQNILSWRWKYAHENCLVIVNYSEAVATCRIKLDVIGYPGQVEIVDVLNEKTYMRSAEDLGRDGLHVVLDAYKSHIFSF